jgi:carotenoid cleavage dioxygenase-like enzyme
MIYAFFFEDGEVRYKNRWVRTERFRLEREAGEALFGSMVDPASTHPSVVGKSSNSANTNVIWHAGKLLALWEAGLPTALDPISLETEGLWDFDGALTRKMDPRIAEQVLLEATEGVGPGIMTAHPKIDPDTGEMHFFGYCAAPPHLVYNVVSDQGRMLRSEEIDVPFPSMMHDFILTSEHVIFPASFDFGAMEGGTGILGWRPELGTHIGVMPRGGGNGDVCWIESDPAMYFKPPMATTKAIASSSTSLAFPLCRCLVPRKRAGPRPTGAGRSISRVAVRRKSSSTTSPPSFPESTSAFSDSRCRRAGLRV